ncbi:LOW QUALITY PROTEIN: rho GTPase-activating protein 30 [Toxotes jaculatrix]|uniref:LOW QUALITY PROTEIN: rho GTPase-activating protein 30 n=1 Tax=Toxotes jaculatrix TaxID=941984 RepID=UPI001B3AB96D|nr:LOW QUALITY PROTEIN: rho GTPase-activating protein 30 [Toxotes jaculatrix]
MRRVRRRGGNKEKVFGCDLLEHLTASCQEIPQVLRCCSEFVESHGIVDGIYRLSGVSSNIQKLRSEFESDGNPDLNKDVYLQDIHCVSSLCKAYFRELPNPLLTYQLYDKFAEAVAIQLEEERLVKIRDVLKELPTQHYRTLEFLMRHLVRMASYSSETNMHARNLAIVWAPNLLRSKDIEATGFNGTAAFMEVRVQSIVVEFILTHVPQLFPGQGETSERRKSLPSPTAACIQDDTLFKSVSTQPIASFGNISPGDGPLPIRPYHAIIEGTDKRKGSLKGRKWMSIFNIGGRFQDQKRRHKPKEKDRTALRPARSMDSLSAPTYPNEGSRRSAQRPPSTHMSPLVTPSPQSGSEVAGSCGALGGSEYAVTYRRGTGLVSGGAGTQGTYTALDPEGLGIAGNETLQSRSPGLSTKAGRRAAMHITGPTLVTVPLHITSNLALGVLQGGGSNRVIHCGRDKDGWDKVEGKEGADKVERKESSEMEMKVEEGRKVEEGEKDREGDLDMEGNTVVAGGVGEERGEGAKEEEKKEEEVTGGGVVSREQRTTSLNSNADNEDTAIDDQYTDDISEYMDMKGVEQPYPQPVATQPGDVCASDASDIFSSSQVEGDDQAMFGYVEDNFEFLDQMDCSVPDHMDCSSFYQVNEFSVEPPGHSDDEYEVMIQPHQPAEQEMPLQTDPETETQSQNELNPHRPLSLDLHSRHTKSLSLPYMTSPVDGPEESCSEEEDVGDNSDDNDYSSEEDESMFIKSLPPDFFLNSMANFELDADKQDSCTLDGLPVDQSKSSEEREFETLHSKEPTTGDQEQGEAVHDEDKDELVGKQIMKTEEEDIFDKQGEHMQSVTAEEDLSTLENVQSDEEKPPASEVSPHCCVDFPLPSNDDIDELGAIKHKEEKEVVDSPPSDYPPCQTDACPTQETDDVSLEESREHPSTCVREETEERHSDEEEDRSSYNKVEATFQKIVLEIKESDENMLDDPPEDGDKGIADKNDEEKTQEGGKEQDRRIHSNEIWEEVDVVECEVTEDEESEQAETEGVAEQGDVEEVREEKEEQKAQVSGDKTVEVEEGGTNGTEVRTEVEEESEERTEEQLTDLEMQQEFEEKGTCLPETSELEKAVMGKHATNEEAQHHDRKEVVSKEPEKENNDKERADEQLRSLPSVDKQLKKARPDMKKLKCEESESIQGGVGRKLVVSKHPKVYQVKAVPIVPPKPQHCKITALTLRQQQQQRERRDADRGRENTLRVPTEQDKEQGKDGGERERRRDGDEGTARDTSRNSPHSMCFDEAVAIATMRREKERVRKGEGEAEGQGK